MTRLLPVAAIGLLMSSGTADAATVTTTPCVNGGAPLAVAGHGFAPHSTVTVRVGAAAEVRTPTDATGGFVISAPTTAVVIGAARNDTVTARGAELTSSGQPVHHASALVRVQRPDPGLKPGIRRASLPVRFAGTGFPTGRTVYAHLRFRGKTIKTRRIGTASGPCGTIRGRVKNLFRVPGVRGGYPSNDRRYSLRVAAARHLRSSTRPTGVIPLHYRRSYVDGRRQVILGPTSWLEGGS